MAKVTLFNPRRAARTIFTDTGKSVIPVGQSAEVDLTDGQLADEKAAGMQVKGKVTKVEKAEPETEAVADKFADMPEDDLRAYIETETGEKPHWKASVDTLREKARAI